jgi:(E)-4-hydroxy-3-methyl-but-2-enyl pyrophosphate reductase
MEIKTAGKLGYCTGVAQAIKQATAFGKRVGSNSIEPTKAYSLGALAHNEDVVKILQESNVEITWSSELKGGENIIIPAHGAGPKTYSRLDQLKCRVEDCTCQYVRKSQILVSELSMKGYDIVIFGDPQHQEVIGLTDWGEPHIKFVGGEKDLFTEQQGTKSLGLKREVVVVSQTTRDPERYAEFITMLMHNVGNDYKELRINNTICPIVAERIQLTKNLAGTVDLMIVVGSKKSANTMNLVEASSTVRRPWSPVLVANEKDVVSLSLLTEWIKHNPFREIGVTAGTSTPIEVVDGVIAILGRATNER